MKIYSQSNSPFLFDCENFNQKIKTSGNNKNINFLSKEIFDYYSKDSIQKRELKTVEDEELNKIFQTKFPNTITKNCINSKMFVDDQIKKIKWCSDNLKIKILEKIGKFYIFKLSGFEINGYYLFDETNKTIIVTTNYPQIIDNSIIIDAGNVFFQEKEIKFIKLINGKIEYLNYNFPTMYNYKDWKIVKLPNGKISALFELIIYDLKEVPSDYGTKKFENDLEKYCIKRIAIE